MWYTSHMWTLYFVLLLAGALCLFGAAIGKSLILWSGRRTIGLLPLGLLFWILVVLIQTAQVTFDQ